MTNFNNLLNGMGGNKLLDRFFRKADNVVWDLMSGRLGFRTREGIVTLDGEGDDAVPSINPFDDFSMELPAFGQQTPIDQIKLGDMILQSNNVGWVVELKGKSIRLLRPNGDRVTFTPPKTQILDFGSGVMVVRSLVNMLPGGASGGLQNLQGMMLPLMMMGDSDMDIEKMLPMMLLMNGANATAADGSTNPLAGLAGLGAGNNMLQTMMLMQMFKGKGENRRPSDRYNGGRPYNT